jgi:GxxExxY protein
MHELRKRRFVVEDEMPVPIEYDGLLVETGYRADLCVNGAVIIENKAVDTILPIRLAQLLTYLKLSKCRIGFLINWKVVRIKDGIRRMIWSEKRS